MEKEVTNNIVFIVVMSAALAVLFIFVVIDLLLLYRKNKRLAEKESQLHRMEVDRLMRQQELKSVNARLEGQDKERNRIARELHDRLGSILFTAKLHFSQMETEMEEIKNRQQQSYHQVTELLNEAVDEVRRISHDLYEGTLAQFGFNTALTQLIKAIEETQLVRIRFNPDQVKPELIQSFEKELYRITQELLSNSLKYADASTIDIGFSTDPNFLYYRFADNGKGFDPEVFYDSPGIGLRNIQSRVNSIKGTVELTAAPENGMSVHIKIPKHEHTH